MRSNFASVALTLCSAWMTMACVSGARPTPTPTPTASATAWSLLPCPALPAPENGLALSLLANHIQVTELYRECGDKHRDLVQTLCLLGSAPPASCDD